MKPPLVLEKTPLRTRLEYAAFGLFMVSFSSVFMALPIIHLFREIWAGNIPWPLIAFACVGVPLGGFFLWCGLEYRIWVLPYRFTVCFSERCCGYVWRKSWKNRTDLAGVQALVAAPVWSERSWPWVIYARFGQDRERRMILGSTSADSTELKAFENCFETCSVIAAYLEVPVEFDEWSPEIMKERAKTIPKGA